MFHCCKLSSHLQLLFACWLQFASSNIRESWPMPPPLPPQLQTQLVSSLTGPLLEGASSLASIPLDATNSTPLGSPSAAVGCVLLFRCCKLSSHPRLLFVCWPQFSSSNIRDSWPMPPPLSPQSQTQLVNPLTGPLLEGASSSASFLPQAKSYDSIPCPPAGPGQGVVPGRFVCCTHICRSQNEECGQPPHLGLLFPVLFLVKTVCHHTRNLTAYGNIVINLACRHGSQGWLAFDQPFASRPPQAAPSLRSICQPP